MLFENGAWVAEKTVELQAWDMMFASERLKEQRYAFSDQEVKQYFTEPKVLDGLFRIIETLFEVAPAIVALYHSREMQELASRIVGEPVRPTPIHDQSSLSVLFYEKPGDHIGWHYDTDTDGDVDSSDPWYHFAYDEAWRQVATFRGSDTAPKEVFVHHAAGLDGHGGSSYIDSVLLREKDASTAWTAASNGLDERVFHCQNWRGDVSVVLSDDGSLLEWIKYSAYGVPYALPAGDTDSDGDWDATDSSQLSTWISAPTYNILGDADLDGDLDTDDSGHANSITGTYLTLGRGVMSSTGINSRRGYAGYEYDSALSGARHISHVRFRVYDADLGRWTRRDPLGYVDGMSLYAYMQAYPILMADPMGLASVGNCAGGVCSIPGAPATRGGGGVGLIVCAGGACDALPPSALFASSCIFSTPDIIYPREPNTDVRSTPNQRECEEACKLLISALIQV